MKGKCARIVRLGPLAVTPEFPLGPACGLLGEMPQELPKLEVLGPGEVGEDEDRPTRVCLPDQRGQPQGTANLGAGELQDDDIADRPAAVEGATRARRDQIDDPPLN